MKLPPRRFLHLAAGAAALIFAVLLTGEAAWSQTIRTIKIVVPLPAGSAADIMSRLFAEQISRAQRVTILVENRPGAAETIEPKRSHARHPTATLFS
jgi:tripartite-type tricarboxylate transporter receptor subunit TctC